MFMTLPRVFEQMPAGQIIGALFFVLVLLAAVTSSISILEASVSMFMDKWHFSRKRAAVILVVFSILLGVPSSLGNGAWSHITVLGMDFLTFFDFFTNSILMPLLALGTCILIGWVTKTEVIEEEITRNGETFFRRGLYRLMIKYLCPVLLVVILVCYTLAQFGVINM